MQTPRLCLTHSRSSEKVSPFFNLFLLKIEFLEVKDPALFVSWVSTPPRAKLGTKKDNKYLINEGVCELSF